MKKTASMLMHMYLPNLEVERCDGHVVNTTYHETNTCTWLNND